MGNETPNQSVVEIDPLNLDKECIVLPSNILKWANRAADLRSDVDAAKAEMDVMESQCSKWIRDTPAKYGLEKVTEPAVKSAIELHPKYKEKCEAYRAVRHELDLAQAVLQALEVKKRSLTLLVELHGMGYFSNVKVSEKGREAVDNMTKRQVRHFREND